MNSSFIVFGGACSRGPSPCDGEIRCMGILVKFENVSIFIFCAIYEIDADLDVVIETGIGVSMIPCHPGEEMVCRRLLCSSGVEMLVTSQPLEDLINCSEKFTHVNNVFQNKIALKADSSFFKFEILGGVIEIENNVAGSLTIKIIK